MSAAWTPSPRPVRRLSVHCRSLCQWSLDMDTKCALFFLWGTWLEKQAETTEGYLSSELGVACRSQIIDLDRYASLAFFVKRLLTDRLPQHLRNVTNAWLSSPPNLRRSVRRASFILALPKPKKECLRRSPLYMSFCLWNKVMVDLRWSKKELPTRPQLTQHCLDTEFIEFEFIIFKDSPTGKNPDRGGLHREVVRK